MIPVRVIGAEIGTLDIHPRHIPTLAAADILVGGTALMARWAASAPAAEPVRLGGPGGLTLTQVLEAVREGWEQHRRVVVLADGDPLYFGLGASLTRLLPPEALSIEPGISVLQTVCARLGLSWSAVHSVSLHGRDDWRSLASALADSKPVCILGDARLGPAEVAAWLLERGVDGRLHTFTNLNTDQERHVDASLQEAVRLHPASVYRAPTMLFLPSSRKGQDRLNPPLARTDGDLVTKTPVRATAVALLKIRPDDVVWDIGSGSGSVAFAASALAWSGWVCAVERQAGRSEMIRENRRALGAANVDVLTTSAPAGLETLPDPDAIFLGGGLGGKNGDVLLRALLRRLRPGGRLVAACILLGSLERLRSCAETGTWQTSVTLVSAAASVPLGRDIRLEGFNPVFLICLEKPTDASAANDPV